MVSCMHVLMKMTQEEEAGKGNEFTMKIDYKSEK